MQYYRRCVIMQDGAAVALDYELLPPEQVTAETHCKQAGRICGIDVWSVIPGLLSTSAVGSL